MRIRPNGNPPACMDCRARPASHTYLTTCAPCYKLHIWHVCAECAAARHAQAAPPMHLDPQRPTEAGGYVMPGVYRILAGGADPTRPADAPGGHATTRPPATAPAGTPRTPPPPMLPSMRA